MHIPDGILPLPVTLGGYAVSMTLAWRCLHTIKQREDPREDIPKAALLTAAFFLTSLIHVPLPPASVHPLLGGLLGVLLGPFAFPAILIGLFFQAVMFGHGGLTTLGVNGIILGVPALIAHGVFRLRDVGGGSAPRKSVIFGFLAGSVAASLSVLIFSLFIFMNMPIDMNASVEKTAILALVVSHIPLILVEGVMTGFVVGALLRSAPRLLHGS